MGVRDVMEVATERDCEMMQNSRGDCGMVEDGLLERQTMDYMTFRISYSNHLAHRWACDTGEDRLTQPLQLGAMSRNDIQSYPNAMAGWLKTRLVDR